MNRPIGTDVQRSIEDRAPVAGSRLAVWIERHLQALVSTLGRLSRNPTSTVLTSAVIGIALALPAGLYAMLDNGARVIAGWEAGAQLTVFLEPKAKETAARSLAQRIAGQAGVGTIQIVDPDAALDEYRRLSGLGEVIDELREDNPLPYVLQVRIASPAAVDIEALAARIATEPVVDLVRHDQQWLHRLGAMINITRKGVYVLGALLGIGVMLIVGNTIRLALDARREEIAISQLFGATDGFVRRPFLYTGAVYGVLGAVIGWMLLEVSTLILQGPVTELAALYAGGFELRPLGLKESGVLLLAGGGFGLTGAWVAIGRHLRAGRVVE